MATSADKLSQILDIACTLSRDGKDNDEVMLELASRELLPKKLLPKPKIEKEVVVSMFASKQAEAAAIQGKLELELGRGSGKQGKYTLADVKNLLEGPKQKPALQLANENGITIAGVVGSGHEGRIVLKDIQALLDSKDKDTVEISITPQALKLLESAGCSKNDLIGIPGSGKEGKLMQRDVEAFLKDKEQEPETEDNDTDEE
jgi:hypothetical protein